MDKNRPSRSGATDSMRAGRSSTLLVLHSRLAEVIETMAALPRCGSGGRSRQQALASLEAEADSLRSAILYQHPSDWPDALLLAHHLSETLSNRDRRHSAAAAAIAAETLFDFLASEVDQDHEPFGEAFQEATVRAFTHARHRRGLFEDKEPMGLL